MEFSIPLTDVMVNLSRLEEKKAMFYCSMVIIMIILLTTCGGQQESLQNTNHGIDNSEKNEVNISEQEMADLPDHDSATKETETGKHDIANNGVVDWSAITVDGINEEMFVRRMSIDNLEYVAQELQTLMQEEYEEEKANPEILLTQGWTRVFSSEHYKNVIAMGDSAMMPLYGIIYKSYDSGQYEYICANALYELSGYDFSNTDGTLKWSTSKELLELFNAELLNKK